MEAHYYSYCQPQKGQRLEPPQRPSHKDKVETCLNNGVKLQLAVPWKNRYIVFCVVSLVYFISNGRKTEIKGNCNASLLHE